MEDSIPIVIMASIITLAIAFCVATGLEWRHLGYFRWPMAERYLDHLQGCGLIYPAVFGYCYIVLECLL